MPSVSISTPSASEGLATASAVAAEKAERQNERELERRGRRDDVVSPLIYNNLKLNILIQKSQYVKILSTL